MGKLIGLVIIVGGFLTWRRWRKLESNQAKRKFAFQAIVGGLLILIVLLAISGRIHPLGAVFAALIPMIKVGLNLLIRGFPLFARLYGANYAKPRTLSTSILEMEINFGTGSVSGVVKQGTYAGKTLQSLSESEIQELLKYCRDNDKKSVYLLQMYIAQRFRQNGAQNHNQTGNQVHSGLMSVDEAAEILGIAPDSTKEDINQAHKKLIGRVHPDKGGNDYLASLLNRARDTLLEK